MDLDPDKFIELVRLGADAMSPAIRSKHNDWPGWPGTYRLAHLALSEVLPRVIPDSGVAPALWDVHSERQRQDQKWGGAEHDDQHTVAEFVQLIQDYAGWARVMDSMNSPQKARTRLIQVAALAVAAVESLDRRAPRAQTLEDNGGHTGSPPGLLQDDSRGLSRWMASTPDARRHAREAAWTTGGETGNGNDL